MQIWADSKLEQGVFRPYRTKRANTFVESLLQESASYIGHRRSCMGSKNLGGDAKGIEAISVYAL